MNWRRWNYVLHRDIGFACIGLTLIYALSGIAVNHVRDWNPNYQVEKVATQIMPRQYSGVVSEAMVRGMLQELSEQKAPESSFQPDPESVWVFIDGRRIAIHFASGAVEQERFVRRPFWYPLNFLHLNHPKQGWTWIADLYAVALMLLAVTGLLMLPRGARPRKRALLLTGAGMLLPLGFLLLYY